MRKAPKKAAGGYAVLHRPEASPGLSPYRLVDETGMEIPQVNEFLDARATSGLSECSLRTYAYGLLSFWRWIEQAGRQLQDLQEPDLLDYIRFQKRDAKEDGREAAPKSLNLRLTVARGLYRFHYLRELPEGRRACRRRSHPYHTGASSDVGYLHPSRPRASQLRVKVPRRVVIPLEPQEIGRFLDGFRTWRDLCIVSLMLLCGLRSREILGMTLGDLSLSRGECRIRGKGDKERVVPLAPQAISLIGSYLEVERPAGRSQSLFVVLKGPRRGQPMTTAGLRSLFRYHRCEADVPRANPHRFRHTFGTDMARAGISLPALMKLMGHGHIETTMVYVELSPQDVWDEFHRIARRVHAERTSPESKESGGST